MKKTGIFLLLLLLTGCGFFQQPDFVAVEPPKAAVIVGDTEIPIVPGSFCWSARGVGKCVDTVSPPELVKNQRPITVKPGSSLEISFTQSPVSKSLGANQWIGGQPSPVPVVEENKIVLPVEKGEYIYDIFAQWEQGSASYAFVVSVE